MNLTKYDIIHSVTEMSNLSLQIMANVRSHDTPRKFEVGLTARLEILVEDLSCWRSDIA